MATIAQVFYPSTTEQDYTASGEVDIRKLAESVGVNDTTTIAAFTTAAATIALDPYTTRSTTGVAAAEDMGWSINRLGSDGMDSTATAKRIIPAGTWTFRGRVGVTGVVTTQVVFRCRVYRVTSAGNRQLLFTSTNSATVTPLTTGVDVTSTSSQSEFVLEVNQCLHVGFILEKTNSGVGTGGSVGLWLNDGVGQAVDVEVPTPGVRTQYSGGDFTQTATMVGVASASVAKYYDHASFPPLTGSRRFIVDD